MAYTSLGFTKDRGNYNTQTSSGVAWHTYDTDTDDFDTIILPEYFPPFIGLSREDVKINDLILIQDNTKLIRVYRVINLDPLTIEIAMSNFGEVKYAPFPAETSVGSDSYRVRRISSNSNFDFNFSAPLDFVSIESASIVGWALSPPAVATCDITSNYGGVGEDVQIHSESVLGITFPLTPQNIKLEVDVSIVLTDLSAGDSGAINLKQNNVGTQVAYTLFELYYRTS